MGKLEKAPEEREAWGNHCEFFLTSLGLAVGLGNVWRFPYVAFQNGGILVFQPKHYHGIIWNNQGGSFLIPYLLMLLLVGLPAFFVELTVGQYARVGANKVFGRMVPAFKVIRFPPSLIWDVDVQGLGYGMLLVRFYVNIYYVVVCAWSLFYLCVGFTSNLPWQGCGNPDRNTIGCYSKRLVDGCMVSVWNWLTWKSTPTEVCKITFLFCNVRKIGILKSCSIVNIFLKIFACELKNVHIKNFCKAIWV